MSKSLFLLLLLGFWLTAALPAHAQDPASADDDGSSEQVEESDEAFRRRMELEDARRRDPGYTPPAATRQAADEKIDGLPAQSRENIRNQLLDVIMENGEWEPADVLEDYPYEPTAAAGADPELLQKEQAAWDEQIEKYHQREAEAFGAYRGAAPGPNDPKNGTANAGGGEGQGGQAGTGGESGQAGSAGSYQPYASSQDETSEETSTAGARQSALEFLQGRHIAAGDNTVTTATAEASDASQDQAETTVETAEPAPPDASRQTDLRGLIAIEDLDKLEGTEQVDEEDPR